jgi:hypothetical protein
MMRLVRQTTRRESFREGRGLFPERKEPSRVFEAKTSRREDVARDATEVTQSDDDDIDVRAFLTYEFLLTASCR